MVAVFFFNTEPSPSPFLEPYQIGFSGSEDFMEHDCYLDCAQLIEETEGYIKSAVANNKEPSILGTLPQERFDEILSVVKQSPVIRKKLKVKYGIY
jgi:hypothetical protein